MNATQHEFHTLGPWHAGHIGDAEFRREVVFDTNAGQVCEVTMPGVQGVHNARLIALAPELLAFAQMAARATTETVTPLSDLAVLRAEARAILARGAK